MNSRFFLTIWAFILFVSSAYTGGRNGDDAKNIQGKWKVVSMTLEGRQRDAEDIQDVWYIISATEINLVRGDRNLLPPRKYSIAPKNKPKQIDFVDIIYTKDIGKKKSTGEKLVMPGIYEIENDTLRICWNGEGVPSKKLERPTNFKGIGQTSLVVLKRHK